MRHSKTLSRGSNFFLKALRRPILHSDICDGCDVAQWELGVSERFWEWVFDGSMRNFWDCVESLIDGTFAPVSSNKLT